LLGILSIWVAAITACAIAQPVPATPTPRPPATATTRPTATPVPTATPPPTFTLTPTYLPLNLSNPRIVVLADGLSSPDDLLLAPDGSFYLSDVGDGTIRRYTTKGQLTVMVSGLSEPEGMVLLPDGSLVIVEQGRNRLVRYDFSAQTLTPFLALENTTGKLGVDGIVLEALKPDAITLIIPDSPNGRVLRVSLNGQILSELGRGFARPTGAWVEPDGSVLVVDETAGTLKRIRPDGQIELIASLPIPDDVIADEAGNIFVNTLGDNALHLISAETKHDQILVNDLADPQGLIFDAEGNLIVAESKRHRLIKIIIR